MALAARWVTLELLVEQDDELRHERGESALLDLPLTAGSAPAARPRPRPVWGLGTPGPRRRRSVPSDGLRVEGAVPQALLQEADVQGLVEPGVQVGRLPRDQSAEGPSRISAYRAPSLRLPCARRQGRLEGGP